ncbi:hypothetical protein [Streptomyces sp. NPDC058240]|uniref:hypothetical protein n=1 Tax=Streptomyces sp. NPDC058240 TaxID=3346396 RepID=UPI0036EDB9F8
MTVPATGIDRTATGAGLVFAGPGVEPCWQPTRIGNVLTGVRQFIVHGITATSVPQAVFAQLYEVAEDWDLLAEARGDEMTGYRLRARHRVQVPRKPRDWATDAEIIALFLACRSARDRFVVLLLGRAGLRRGGAAGLRCEDMHFMPDSTALGCRWPARTCICCGGRTRTGRGRSGSRPAAGGPSRSTSWWCRLTTST